MMIASPAWILIGTVAAVGVMHTIVPDHWVPLTVVARQRGWSTTETLRAAFQAGLGHVLSTLVIAALVWGAGLAFAQRFGTLVDLASGCALIAFGGWIAVSGWRAMRDGDHGHSHTHHFGHGHDHGAHGHGDHHDHGGHLHDHHRHGRDDHDDVERHHHDGEGDADAKRDPLYLPLRGNVAMAAPHLHTHRHGRGPAHSHWHEHQQDQMHPWTAGQEHSRRCTSIATRPIHVRRFS